MEIRGSNPLGVATSPLDSFAELDTDPTHRPLSMVSPHNRDQGPKTPLSLLWNTALMQDVNRGQDGTVTKALRVLARTTGGAVGLVAGGMILGWLPVLILFGGHLVVAADSASFIPVFVLGFLGGALFGVAGGIAAANKALGQKTSFWKAFLGGMIGLLIGGLLQVPYNLALIHNSWDADAYFTISAAIQYAPVWTGAVIGSAWRRPARW